MTIELHFDRIKEGYFLIKYCCDNCKEVASDMKLIIYDNIPIIVDVYATGNRGGVKLIKFDNLKFKEMALCEKCRKKYEEIYDYGMSVIAKLWQDNSLARL